MSRIETTFARLAERREKALVGFVTAGDPDADRSLAIVRAMCAAGLDVLELGVPFSDPLADGPTIQKAALRSLQRRTSIKDVLGLVADVRKESKIPLILMTYYNLIFKYGEERFVSDAVSAGLDGVILPDLPPEEAGTLVPPARKAGCSTIARRRARFVTTPSTTVRRSASCRPYGSA